MTDRSASAPILADLTFWIAVSAVVLVGSSPVADAWGAPRTVLVTAAAAVLVLGLAGFAARARLRGAAVLGGFGWANLAIAPVLLLLAALDVLGLTRAGNVALAIGGLAAALFGGWQVASGRVTSRRRS